MPDHLPDLQPNAAPRPRGYGRWALDGAVVLAIIIILGLFWLMVMESGFRQMSKQSQCVRHQSQILGAIFAYASSEEVGLLPRHVMVDPQVTGATRGRSVTTKAFETLSLWSSLGPGLFRCPSSAIGVPNRQVKPDPGNPASTWGWDEGNGLTYAFDWAAPPDPSSSRVLLADRNPQSHKDGVMVIFGDMHVTKVKLLPVTSPVAGSLLTEGIGGKPVAASTADLPDDDIYSTAGDAGDPLMEGKGDPLRAWVK